MKIRYKLIAAFLFVVLVPLMLSSFMLDSKMAESILHSYEKKDQARIETIISELRSFEMSAENYIYFLAQDPNLIKASYYATTLNTHADLEVLLPQMKEKLGLSYLQILNTNGRSIYSVHDDDAKEHEHGSSNFSDAMAGEGVKFRFNQKHSTYEIAMDAPILRKGKIIAYVHGGYLMDKVFLNSLSKDVTVSLYHPTTESLITTQKDDIDVKWILSVLDRWGNTCGEGMKNSRCGELDYLTERKMNHDILHLFTAAPLVSSAGQFIGVLAVSEEALQMYEDMKQSRQFIIMLTLMALAAAVLIGSLLAGTLSRPIEALKLAALCLGKGDLSTQVDIKSKDELGVLAQGFNQMAQQLSGTTVSKDYVENILASMADALIVVNAEGKISRLNQASMNLLGVSEQELLGQDIGVIIPDKLFLKQAVEQLDQKDKFCNQENTYLNKDGNEIEVQISAANLFDADHKLLGTAYVAQDIRERKQAERSLANKNEELSRTINELDQFAYVVSHDLKAPLRGIANLAEWIREDLEELMSDDTRQQMIMLNGRVLRMENLINGILEYSRVGRVDTFLERVDTQEIISDVIETMPVPKGYTIEVGPNMPKIDAAAVQLGQVFSNLISNAIKYRKHDEGQVSISVEDLGDSFRFSVQDDGIGIDPCFHEKVFVIFQTLTARDKVESTGVGLSLVKKIIEEHGGEVWLDSEESKGATFHFTWPKKQDKKLAA